MSSYSAQLREEQQAVSRAYDRLDALRAQARSRLDTVRAAGSHGSPTQRTERDSFATMYEDRLTQLRAVEDRLVFGRLDDVHGAHRYIGRIGLSDEDHEPILTDWRADAARPFYEATPSNHGDIVMRRHITLSFREVVGVEDEVLDVHSDQVGEASSNGTLTGEGALLASLNAKRTGKMTDIVATIQGEQDRIIRADLNQAVVVQGGPGTGKTAVALHRAAYLLYTHRRALQRSGVLVVGPSSTFLHYIDQVLPSLGETGVVSRTIADLIPGIIATAHDDPYAAKLKGERRMAKAIANAVAARERVPSHLPVIRINGFNVPMVRADMMQQLCMNDDLRKTLNLAWLPMTGEWLVDQLFAKPQQLRRFAPWLEERDIKTLTRPKGSPFTVSDVPLLDEAMELLGPDPKAVARQKALDAKRAEEEQFAKDTLAQAGIGSGIVTSQMLVDNINGMDAELTAQRAAADREWTYGHIVVDEAQELTAMDWRMLIRRCPSRSFTIVGDVAQTSALGGTRSWRRMMDPLFISTVNAVRGVPDSVKRLTLRDDSLIGDAVAQQTVELVRAYVSSDGTGRVAIIAPDDMLKPLRARVYAQLQDELDPKEFDRLDAQSSWDEQVTVCSTQTVKGLEYDAVMVVQPGRIEENAPSRIVAASDLYVAMTRPTQRLLILRTKDDEKLLKL